MPYDHKQIEKKWQEKWAKSGIFKTNEDSGKKKFYALDMFPYPSGAGLHVGHPKGYIATDVVARTKMMQGFSVLHPMGWDAFGLPAENFAIKNKVHPAVATKQNIEVFKKQLSILGFTYDWDREVNTTDPKYYKWTQWAFLQMFKKGLAYESFEPINWCPSCQTGLANEDLDDGKCERCGSVVEQKPMRQWVLKITDYADRLLADLDKLTEWPDSIKQMQREWIGKSEGAEVTFKIVSPSPYEGEGRGEVRVFTTRPDTLFGATYMVLAPEHSLVSEITTSECRVEVENYLAATKAKTDIERGDDTKEKTGVFTGAYAINPANNEKIPIWVADYVLMGYGTGAIMAVPAHDERDFAFATKYNLPIKQVVAPHFIDPANPPHEGVPESRRKNVHVIIRNPKDGKVLLLNWFSNITPSRSHLHTFIIGGIEGDEDLSTAAIREATEETGYKNFKFVKDVGFEVHTEYFAAHKGQNRYAQIRVAVLDLVNDDHDEIPAEELKNHEPVWFDESEVEKTVNVVDGPMIWYAYKEGAPVFVEEGVAINSDFLDGLPTWKAKADMISWLEEKGLGQCQTQYKLRDWVFSRQRYWGEPIPLVHCAKCGVVALPEDQLPLELPQVEHYEPTGTGESPLANIDEWVNTTCPNCGGPAKRETNTMPQWAGSCWYYLRYMDPKNDTALVDAKKEKYWSPVDLYVGGAEHATRHLIYARFWHKFLFDIGAVSVEEPFTRLQNVGLILAEDGRKMSKRWGNVINPDDMVNDYGADALRVYEMFMGPFNQPAVWSTNGLVGTRRFLERVSGLEQIIIKEETKKVTRALHQTIKKVSEDIDSFRFNTAVAQMMTFVNVVYEEKGITKDNLLKFVRVLCPFAPHLANEIYSSFGGKGFVEEGSWPEFDPELVKEDEVTIAVQVNGKLRGTIVVSPEAGEAEVKAAAETEDNVKKYLDGKEIVKTIFVPGKLMNIVIK
ncbi:MAG: leucine--tRNA ligase [Patescibacteria group bacterium]|jgi:leucyl-tRNA synthetase